MINLSTHNNPHAHLLLLSLFSLFLSTLWTLAFVSVTSAS